MGLWEEVECFCESHSPVGVQREPQHRLLDALPEVEASLPFIGLPAKTRSRDFLKGMGEGWALSMVVSSF